MLSAFRRSNKRVDVILILQVRPIGAVLDVDDMDIAVDTRSLCDDTRSFDDCLLDSISRNRALCNDVIKDDIG